MHDDDDSGRPALRVISIIGSASSWPLHFHERSLWWALSYLLHKCMAARTQVSEKLNQTNRFEMERVQKYTFVCAHKWLNRSTGSKLKLTS